MGRIETTGIERRAEVEERMSPLTQKTEPQVILAF
jgi:hypothetical protein